MPKEKEKANDDKETDVLQGNVTPEQSTKDTHDDFDHDSLDSGLSKKRRMADASSSDRDSTWIPVDGTC